MVFCPSNFYCAADFHRRCHIRGGTSILINKKLDSKKVDVSNFSSEIDFEISVASIDSIKVVVASIYHSPSGDPYIFLEYLEDFLTFLSNDKWRGYSIIIGGDLNINFDITKDKKTVRDFQNLLRQYNYRCANDKPTRGAHCLDNIFHNCSDQVNFCKIFDFPFSDHDGLILNLQRITSHKESSIQSENPFIISLQKSAINDFMHSLLSHDWNLLINHGVHLDGKIVFHNFFQVICNKLEFFSSLKRRSLKTIKMKSCNDWYTNDLAQMKERLLFLHRLKTNYNYNCERFHANYLDLKRRYKMSIENAKLSYNAIVIEKSNNKCKTAWRIINESTNSNNFSSPTNLNISPDNFNTFFVNVIKETKNSIVKTNIDSSTLLKTYQIKKHNFTFSSISNDDVIKAVKRLKNSDSTDIFLLSNNIMKQVYHTFLTPLTILINKCLAEGFFSGGIKVVPNMSYIQKRSEKSTRELSTDFNCSGTIQNY
jgi:hypothetical protein